MHFHDDLDLKPLARHRYQGLKVSAADCIACRACMPRCPFHINIPGRLRQAHHILQGV
ncbi:MAG: 4Fe-4S binding protein [Planctomycetota bacterium]